MQNVPVVRLPSFCQRLMEVVLVHVVGVGSVALEAERVAFLVQLEAVHVVAVGAAHIISEHSCSG